MKFVAYASFILKDLYFDLGRSLLTILSLAAVVASFLAASALTRVFREYGSQPKSGAGELLVMSAAALEPMQSKMDASTLDVIAAIVRRRFGAAALRSAFPVIYRSLEINGRTMQLMAIPRENMVDSYDLTLLEGRWPEKDDEIAVTEEGLQLNHWVLGEKIPLRGTSLLITGKVREETVTSVIWMPYSGGQTLFNVRDEFQIGVLMLDGALDLTDVQAALEADPAFPNGYAAYLNQQLYDRYSQMVSDLVRVARIISVLALVVILFGSFNAASLTMTERKADLALLQMVGFRRGMVSLFLLGRTLLQALAAFLLAWGAVAWLVKDSLKYPVIFFARLAVLQLTPSTLLVGFLLTMVSAALGVWLTVQSQGRRTLADQLRE